MRLADYPARCAALAHPPLVGFLFECRIGLPRIGRDSAAPQLCDAIPARTAHAASAERELRSSLRMTLWTCPLTVVTLMKSDSAISGFVAPVVRRRKTSTPRLVSPFGSAGAVAEGGGEIAS